MWSLRIAGHVMCIASLPLMDHWWREDVDAVTKDMSATAADDKFVDGEATAAWYAAALDTVIRILCVAGSID